MGKKGRLKPKHRRDGERRMAAGRDRPKPVIACGDLRLRQEWLRDGDDAEAGDQGCEG